MPDQLAPIDDEGCEQRVVLPARVAFAVGDGLVRLDSGESAPSNSYSSS
jgi:hypothetical protein